MKGTYIMKWIRKPNSSTKKPVKAQPLPDLRDTENFAYEAIRQFVEAVLKQTPEMSPRIEEEVWANLQKLTPEELMYLWELEDKDFFKELIYQLSEHYISTPANWATDLIIRK